MNLTKRFIGLTLLMLLSILTTYAQRISVSYEKEPLVQVFFDLKSKTGYDFIYQKKTLEEAPLVTLEMENVTLQEVLDRLLYRTNLDYDIVKEGVVIHPRQRKQVQFDRYIKGIVVDENGEALPGANVRLKGTNLGAICDANGNFTLHVDNTNSILIFSNVGMKEKEFLVTSKTSSFVTIEMVTDVKLMGKVLITGYQKIKRENATGAYQVITAEDMDQSYNSNIVNHLEGKVAGMLSYRTKLKGASDESTMTIRGISSFAARTNPLVVVDGLPIEGSIETINSYEISSITVLKDAAAVAIYGARASNGVIVVTTKQAKSEKLTVDFDTDLTIYNKQSYDNYNYCNGAELVELEQDNFAAAMDNAKIKSAYVSQYTSQALTFSPITQLMMNHYLGKVNDSDYQSQINRWKKNDYQKEWSDLMLRNQVVQQYNLALRTMGKNLSSSIVMNYKDNSTGMINQYDRNLLLSYRGDLKAFKWLDFSFGFNMNSQRSKYSADLYGYKGRYAFPAYLSMYNDDGSMSEMKAEVDLAEPSLSVSSYGLKSEKYNLRREKDYNFTAACSTNIRTFIHANVNILPELKASTEFQYEDIFSRANSYYDGDSYDMHHIYNLFTYKGIHSLSDGGLLKVNNSDGGYYTFRAQTEYLKTFANKHVVNFLAGMEYRQTHATTTGTTLIGYDDQTQTNTMNNTDLHTLSQTYYTDLGTNFNYKPFSATNKMYNFNSSDVLHRFYSYYFNGGYVYDGRYSASFSYRVDKTDLFGADPKYRGRPLWSVGLSWNVYNEKFMKSLPWINVLKLRSSYGLTGNIASDISSYLTANVSENYWIGENMAKLNTPPNDQLRWEKTASYNVGADFSLFQNRISGSFDWYRKNSSDLLTSTQLDTSTGWSSLLINSGKALNSGVELQLNGALIRPQKHAGLGINASFGFAYNKNEVKSMTVKVSSGFNQINAAYHKGYPINSIFSFKYGGLVVDNAGSQQVVWVKNDGTKISDRSIASADFAVGDAIFSGALDPKYTASFTPEITYKGFTLSSMFSYYGGHYMRANVADWTSAASYTGYSSLAGVPRGLLNYWRSDDKTAYLANGAATYNMVMPSSYMAYVDQNVMPADFIKLRNVVLGYSFSRLFCRHLGVEGIRLRLQMNNVATWVRNSAGIDPEANNQYSGTTLDKMPKSYTMSLKINL